MGESQNSTNRLNFTFSKETAYKMGIRQSHMELQSHCWVERSLRHLSPISSFYYFLFWFDNFWPHTQVANSRISKIFQSFPYFFTSVRSCAVIRNVHKMHKNLYPPKPDRSRNKTCFRNCLTLPKTAIIANNCELLEIYLEDVCNYFHKKNGIWNYLIRVTFCKEFFTIQCSLEGLNCEARTNLDRDIYISVVHKI